MKGISKSFYYVLYKIEDPQKNNFFIKYFRTSQEIAEYLDISRPTVFNLIKGNHKSKIHKKYIIEKLDIPIKRIVEVELDDEEIY